MTAPTPSDPAGQPGPAAEPGVAPPAPAPTTPPAPVAPGRAPAPDADGAALAAQLADAQAAARVTELESAAQAAEERARLAEHRLTRLTATRAAGLPDAFADRLTGTDETELAADAAALVELIKTAAAPTTPPPPAPTPAAAPLPPGRRPVEALTPASATGTEGQVEGEDPASIARLVFGGK